jgi:hypothetical protein
MLAINGQSAGTRNGHRAVLGPDPIGSIIELKWVGELNLMAKGALRSINHTIAPHPAA